MLVDGGRQRQHTIDVVVCAGEDSCARRRADRIGHIAAIESHALSGQPVNIRGVVYSSAILVEIMPGQSLYVDKYCSSHKLFKDAATGRKSVEHSSNHAILQSIAHI